MQITIEPEQFAMVDFDADRLSFVVQNLAERLGLSSDEAIHVHVDETTPRGRVRLIELHPITIAAESGALEDPKAPRKLSESGAAEALGRQLLSAIDRLDGAFDAPTFGEKVPSGVAMAWDVYCVTRLGRAGYPVSRQRRLYQFRNRFGFTDVADAAFDRLWEAGSLTYANLEAIAAAAVSDESAVGVGGTA